MAVTITNVLAGVNAFSCTVIATADVDTTATCPHGLGVVPKIYGLTLILAQVLSVQSAWAITTVNATNIVATKQTTVGSGNAAPQLAIFAMTPHSLIS